MEKLPATERFIRHNPCSGGTGRIRAPDKLYLLAIELDR